MREEKELATISGKIISVIYQNEENGYTVLRILSGEAVAVVVGCIPYAALGEELFATGEWISHPNHGTQFKAHTAERRMPETSEGIVEYLSSGIIKGLGPVMAKRIVEAYGGDSLNIIENFPDKLTSIKGLTAKKAEQIGKTFRAQSGMRRLIEFLEANGLHPQTASRLYRNYGDMAQDVLRENPYILVGEYYGVSFMEADRLAENCGILKNDMKRAEACVLFVLSHNLQNGHAFIPRRKLIPAVQSVLQIEEDYIEKAADSLLIKGEAVCEAVAGEEAIYLRELYDAECYAASRLTDMSKADIKQAGDIEKIIAAIEKEHEIKYAPAQKEVIKTAARSKIMLLTGGPGTGKTTSVRGVIALFDKLKLKTTLTAPTGRAAKRMSELCGRDASTIHRLLEMGFDHKSGEFLFSKNENNTIKADAVIVDETSMVDILLFKALLKALPPGCRLIMVGDSDQLPSVGPGNLLSDMVRSKKIQIVQLTEIFRQAEKSAIIMNAHAINRGEMPDLSRRDADFFFLRRMAPENTVETILELCKTRLPDKMGINPTQIQVLSPTRLYRTGTVNLNRCLQEALNPPSPEKTEKQFGEYTFRTGDRVMQIKNNYDIMWRRGDGMETGLGMFNGDVGKISSIDIRNRIITVDFDGRYVMYEFDMLNELELAYATTVHKSQGSEYDAVILALNDGAPFLFSRNVLYTAVTRAKNLLIIVGEDRRVGEMVKNNRQSKRYSGLKARLSGL